MYDGTDEPTGSYALSRAEGDVFFKRGDYRKAVESFTTALDFLTEETSDKKKLVVLIARSQCYLELGEPDKALIDANETLVDDPNYVMGLRQKAEAYYQQANFEMALIFYHRGNNLRPEVQEFRTGIEKAHEAIDNSIGETAAVKLQNKGDLTFFNGEKPKKVKPKKTVEIKQPVVRRVAKCGEKLPYEMREEKKTIRQLLGDLYSDREFLRNLLEDGQTEKNTSETRRSICNLVSNGLSHLDERMEFWQQQQRPSKSKKELEQWSLDNLKAIDKAQASGKYGESLKQAKQMLNTVENWSAEELKHALGHPTQLVFPNKAVVLGDLHNYIGNAYFELGRDKMALFHYERDLEIAKKRHVEEVKEYRRQEKKELEQWSLDNLEAIKKAQASGKYRESLKQAKEMLNTVANWSAKELEHAHERPTQLVFPNKVAVLGDLHKYIDIARCELGREKWGLKSPSSGCKSTVEDSESTAGGGKSGRKTEPSNTGDTKREFTSEKHVEEVSSRALVNIGRVYARKQEYKKAIDVWNESLELSKTPLESAWLCHEIGKCYLEMGIEEQKKGFNFRGEDVDCLKQARNYGAQSNKWAVLAEDDVWQLNAGVLVAQACLRLDDLQSALDQFKSCFDMAKKQEDKPAELAINNAIEDILSQIRQEQNHTSASEGIEKGERQQVEEGRQRSQERKVKTEQEAASPQQEAASPQQGAASPQQEAASPQQGAASPEEELESPKQQPQNESSPVKNDEEEMKEE